jgi:glycosyltransferase involved in cell wall biosynthesis
MGVWYTPGKLAVLRFVSTFVDRYVANCRAVAQVVQQKEWVPCRKISVIYNGINPAADDLCGSARVPEMLPPPEKAPVIGIVANLKPIKRIDVLMRAVVAVRARYPGLRLLVIGRDGLSSRGGSMCQELDQLAIRLGIRDAVIFTGGVDDPAPLISRFTVAVLCSESEGFSNALIEYMQAGRPVVCTDTGGNPELVQDGINGFVIPVGDVDQLADRIIRILSDSALANRLGEAARKTVRSYSLARMLSEQMACYDEVLSTCGSKRECKSAASAAQ